MLKNSSPCITHTIFCDRLVEHRDVLLARLPGGAEIRFQIVADVHAGVDQLVLLVAGQHDLHVQVGQAAQIIRLRPC